MVWENISVWCRCVCSCVFIKKHCFKSEKIKIAGIAIVGLLAIVGISYGLSSGQEILRDTGEQMVSESASKLVGTGLRVFYILIIVALGAIVASGVKKALNK